MLEGIVKIGLLIGLKWNECETVWVNLSSYTESKEALALFAS